MTPTAPTAPSETERPGVRPLEPTTPRVPAPIEVRPKTPQEVGEHAARYIEEHGWTRGYLNAGAEVPDGTVCAWVAIHEVSGDDLDLSLQASKALARLIRRSDDGNHYAGIFGWNDAPERRVEEVLAALRAIR